MTFRYDQFRTFVESYYKHPESGIKACEKKLKKDPQNFLYLLAHAQLLWQTRNYEAALEGCLALKFDGTTDPNLLSETQAIVCQCEHALGTFKYVAPPKIAVFWKDALDKCTKDGQKVLIQEMRTAMFRAAWRDEYWDVAQQLFARLQKEYPNQVQYHYAWVALSQLQADQMPKDDRMGQSLKMLAFRSLQAAVENTLKEKDTARKITNSHHLRLVSQIYIEQGKKDELLELYGDTKVGINSSVGKGDGEFTRLEIQLLKEDSKKNSKQIFKQTYESLSKLVDAKSKENNTSEIESLSGADDWFIWEALVESAFTVEDSKYQDDLKALIERFLKIESQNRNVGRAYLTYHAKSKSDLLDACIRYFDAHCTRRACFGDLKDFLPQVSHEEQGKFIEHIDKAAKSYNPFKGDGTEESNETTKKNPLHWVAVNINALKFEYLLCVSKTPLPDKESLEQFVSDSLHMYKGALGISKDCGDEACILAVMGLVKLHHFSRDYDLDEEVKTASKKSTSVPPKAYLIQALMLLEFLQAQSPHNYSASLLAVLLAHQTLCLTSVATEAILPLAIKEIQHDTISHIFWSRIGITHPFPCMDDMTRRVSSSSGHDLYRIPVRGMAVALDWYDSAGDRMMQFMGDMLDTVPFDKIDEFAKFKQSVEHSFSHAGILLEARRMARLTGSGLQIVVEPLPTDFGINVQDGRDWKTIPSFEYEEATEHFGNFVSTRPKPMRFWLARQISNDILQTLLVVKSPPKYVLELLDFNMKYLSTNSGEISYQLSPSEQLMSKQWDLLQPIILWLIGVPPTQTASQTPVPSRPGSSANAGSPPKGKPNNISNLAISKVALPPGRSSSPARTSNPSESTTRSHYYRSSHAPLADLATLVNWMSSAMDSTRSSAPEADVPGDLIPGTDVIQDLYLRLEFIQTLHALHTNLISLIGGNKARSDPRAAQLLKSPSGTPSAVELLKELAKIISTETKVIRNISTTWTSRLRENGAQEAIGKLLDLGPTGEDVMGILEGWTLKDKRIKEFWGAAIDSVESVGRVTVG